MNRYYRYTPGVGEVEISKEEYEKPVYFVDLHWALLLSNKKMDAERKARQAKVTP